jgi:hypothetical protein
MIIFHLLPIESIDKCEKVCTFGPSGDVSCVLEANNLCSVYDIFLIYKRKRKLIIVYMGECKCGLWTKFGGSFFFRSACM